MTYKEMAEDVFHFIKEQDLGSDLIVLGHSIGARVAMEMSVTQPNAFKGVIAVDLAPYNYRDDHRFSFPEDLHWKMQKLSQINLSQDIYDVRRQILEVADTQAEGELYLSSLNSDGYGGFKWKFNLNYILKNLMPNLMNLEYKGSKTYHGPVKVICGEKSDYIAPDIVHTFHRTFENFYEERDLTWIEDAAHWVHYSNPYMFLVEVSQFLQLITSPEQEVPGHEYHFPALNV